MVQGPGPHASYPLSQPAAAVWMPATNIRLMGAVPQVVTMPAARPLAVRVAAVVAFFACLHHAVGYDWEVFWAAVVVYMTELVPDHTVVAGYLHRFVGKWAAQFVALGHVLDRTRRHPNIPFHEACRIADAPMPGRMVDVEADQVSGRKRKRGKVKVKRRMWYRCLHEFVVWNEWVQAVMNTYSVTSVGPPAPGSAWPAPPPSAPTGTFDCGTQDGQVQAVQEAAGHVLWCGC